MKSRKVLTILLSLAIMFTFMPAMAFATTYTAGTVTSWGADYATATAKCSDDSTQTFSTYRTFKSDGGLITAVPQKIEATVEGGDDYTAPTSSAYFYELDGSSFVYGSSYKALDGTTWTQSAFEKLLDGTTNAYVQLVEPSYTEAYKAAVKEDSTYTAKTAQVDLSSAGYAELTNWTIYVDMSDYESGLETDQTVTFSVESIDATSEVDATSSSTPDLQGTVATATVTVKGEAKTPSTAKFYLDSTDSLYSVAGGTSSSYGSLRGLYDGAAHTLVCDATPGYTVAYAVYNNGKWVSTDTVSITDVQESVIKVRARFTKTSDSSTTDKYVELNMDPAQAKIGFDRELSSSTDENIYYVDGSEYNALDYVTITPNSRSTKSTTDADEKARIKAANAANAAAVAANSSDMYNLFNALYEITATASKTNADKLTLAIEDQDLTSTQTAAIKKEYAQLIRNFAVFGVDPDNDDATLYLNSDVDADYEVTFTKAVSSKVYKGSKTTKKGKLKKNQTIQFTAEAANGAAVKYKLVNVNTSKISIDSTGKLTIKKGLAKGTYKFQVKAYVPEVQDAVSASEVQNVTIKIKK